MVSIVIPAYESAQWIGSVVDAIRSQTFADWEVIVVDDGSTDPTRDIIERLAQADSRIRYVGIPHSGVAAARNAGIDAARGEYLAFIDSDDLWPPYALEWLISLIERHDAGIAGGSLLRFADGREARVMQSCEREWNSGSESERGVRVMSGKQALEESLYQSGVEASLCGKLYRRDVIGNERFSEGMLYEDLDMFHRVVARCRRYVDSRVTVYLYRQREGSIIHSFNSDRLIVLDVTRRIEETVAAIYPELRAAAVDRRYSANFNMLLLLLRALRRADYPDDATRRRYRACLAECCAYIRRHSARELRNPRVRFKNRIGALAALLATPLLAFGAGKSK
ncbi:MAG: glycosyltransferase [Muribaculaceae bacterium]|nr:glycosyltransferase [Muribaculaceae bacterium]